MKKLSEFGYKLVPYLSVGNIHAGTDCPWPTHAKTFLGTQTAMCASGSWTAYARFTLDTGTEAYCPYTSQPSQADAAAVIYGYSGYPYDLPGGEYLGRRVAGHVVSSWLDIIASTDLPLWLAAH